jgi:hypothetical protein
MGYRSNVALALPIEVDVAIRLNNSHINTLLSASDKLTREKHNVYYWEDITWYEGYPDIREMQKALRNLNAEEYGFIRIGKETDDIESQGAPWAFDMYVSRQIEF